MLKQVYLDNFRCFSNFTLEPARSNLLLGGNGSGKSSLFDAITALVRLVRSGVEVREVFPPESRTRWDTRSQQRFELSVALDEGLFRYELVLQHDADTAWTTILDERVSRDGSTLFAWSGGEVQLHRNDGSLGTRFPFRPNRSFLAELEPRPENTSLFKLLDFFTGLRVFKPVPSSFSSVTTQEERALASDGSNFASWYRHIAQERPGELHQVFTELKKIVPGFDSLALVSAGKQGRVRDLMVKLNAPDGPPYLIDFEELSDGQRVLLVLYTLLLDIQQRPGLVLLDEPENYVGLTEIQPWLVALDDALGDDGQLLMISHHPEVIDYLAAEHPIFLTRDGAGPVRVRDRGFGFDREGGLKASEQLARGLLDGP